MLKAVIDTSVFVSALIKSPSCRKIIQALEKESFILVVSSDILAELIGVIARPKFHHVVNRDIAARLIEVIKTQALFVNPGFRLSIVKDDPDDNCFLEAALTARANCIVSLDNHLLKLGSFRGISVVKPTAFLNLLENKS